MRSTATLWRARKRIFGIIASRRLSGIGDYLRARTEKGIVRHTLGDGAIALVATAIEHIHHIAPAIKGTWGAYDLEWIRELWLDGLRKNLSDGGTMLDDLF